MQQYRPFFLAFVATQRELVDDGDQPINASNLELCKMDAPESKIWKLKRSACRALSNIVKRISSHSTQWSDSHTRVGMLPLGGAADVEGEGRKPACMLLPPLRWKRISGWLQQVQVPDMKTGVYTLPGPTVGAGSNNSCGVRGDDNSYC